MNKHIARKRRAAKSRAIIRNTDRPRLVIFRSSSHIYSQIIVLNEQGDEVLASASTIDKEMKGKLKGDKSEQAELVGKLLAKRALEKKISKVAFDRAGYKFHGRVASLAKGAREAGLDF